MISSMGDKEVEDCVASLVKTYAHATSTRFALNNDLYPPPDAASKSKLERDLETDIAKIKKLFDGLTFEQLANELQKDVGTYALFKDAILNEYNQYIS